MKLFKIHFLLIFAGLLFAAPVFADTSTRGCETNTMKSGEFCNWAEGKSWCAGNTLTCAVESTTPCPANPANGTYAFSCNSNSCVLSCNSGYTKCSTTCIINGSMPNCTTYDTCTDTCTTCNPGYTWNGSSCAAATLKLGSTSVSGATGVVQAATNPQLFISGTTIGLGISNPTANLHLVSNTNTEGLRIISSNYSPFIIRNTANTEDLFRIDQDGNITSKGSLTGSNSFWNINGGQLYASSTAWNVGIGITNPTEKLTVVGAINSNSAVNGVSLCIAGDCKTSWGDAGWSFDGNTVGQTKSFGTLDNYAIPFLSNGVERMRLTESGNFVLGATSTGVRLHVESPQGAVAFFKSKLNGGSYAGYIGNGQTFTGEEFGLYYALNDQRMATYNLTNSLLLYGGHLSSDPALAINAAGDVGVGLTNPGAKLEVLGTFRVNGALNSVVLDRLSGTGNRIVMADSAGSLYATSSAAATGLPEGASGQTLRHDGTKWLANSILYNNGTNVGIGTTNPAGKLDVSAGLASQTAGDLVVNTASNTVYLGKLDSNSGNTTFIFRDRLGNQKSKWFNAGAGSIFFGNMISPGYGVKIQASNVTGIASNATTAAKLEVDSESATFPSAVFMSGNVGVGTTTPAQPLTVKTRTGAPYAALEIQSYSTYPQSLFAGAVSNTSLFFGSGYYYNSNLYRTPGTESSIIRFEGGDFKVFTNSGLTANTDFTPTERFRINSSGNVGINTTNPGARLEVVGTFRVNGALNSVVLDRLSGTGNRIVMTDASGSLYATSSAIASGLPGGSTGQTLRSDGTSWLANSTIYNNGTNVGIGVTPMTKLDVNGNLAVRGDNIILGSYDENASQSGVIDGDVYPYVMRFKINTDDSGYSWGWTHRKVSDGAETHAMLLTASGARAALRVDSNITAGPLTGAIGTIPAQTTYVKLGAAGASETSYFNAGNVGIGTTNPVARLNVAGTQTNLSSTTNVKGVVALYDDTSWAKDVGGALSFGGRIDTTNFYQFGAVKGGKENPSLSDAAGYLSFYTSPNTGILAEKMRINSTGNVGIGTSTPAAQLSVSGGNIFINDAVINSGTPKAAITWEYLNSALSSLGSTGNWALSGSNLYASSTSWNVGIGTTNPGYKLDVNGIIKTNNRIMVESGNGTTAMFLADEYGVSESGLYSGGGYRIATYHDYDSVFQYADGSIYVDSSNVGIGNTSPASKLSVSGGNVLINDAVISPSNPKAAITWEYLNSALSAISSNSNWILSGSNLYASSTTWNVGIGTTTPSQKLTVAGNALIDAGNMLYFRDTTTYINEGSGLNIVAGNSRSLNLAGGTGTDLTITSAGNVGIGTTTPGAKLEVSGNIRTTVDNALPNFVMDSSGSGDNWTSQGAYISLGESGALGSASLHLTYIGNGTSYIGSGAVTAGVPAQSYLRFAYDSKNIYTDSNLQNAATGNSYFMGNLGIGTTTPNTKLQIANAGAASTSGQDTLKLTGILNAGVVGSGPVLRFTDSNGTSNMASVRGYTFGAGATGLAFETGWTANAVRMVIDNSGNVGIGTTTPATRLTVIGSGNYSIDAGNYRIGNVATPTGPLDAVNKSYLDSAVGTAQNAFWNLSGSNLYASSTSWNVGIGTTSPTAKLHVIGNAIISTSLTMGGDINMGSNNITNLTKLTVNTIDPLYNIKGVNYSTFAASIVGGVKEEYVGRIKLARLVDGGEYEAVVDFDQVKEGSDLWVWRHTVDFSADNVQVLITPYGGFAEVYYQINGNSLVLRADRPADISYRLIGKRLDWRQWPTRAKDQEEKAGFVID